MPEADGYVRINTEFDDSKLTNKLRQLGSKLNRELQALDKAKSNAEGLRRELEQITSGAMKPKSVLNLEKEIERTEKDAERINKQLNSLTTERRALGDQNINGVNDAKIADLNERIDELTAKFVETVSKADELREKLAELQLDPSKTEEAGELAEKLRLTESEMERISIEAENTRAQMEELKESANIEPEVQRTTTAFEKFGNYINRLAKRMLVLYAFRRVFTYIRNSIMGMTGLSIVTSELSGFISKMREAYASNEQVQSALARLRGALYTSFAPIYNAVVPALVTLINWLATAISYIGTFFAALSGQSFEDSTQGAEDLAGALNGVGGAAKKAGNQLASFDKLNTLSDTSGGGGGGGGNSPVNFDVDQTKLEEFFSWVQEHMEAIKTIAKDIGIIFLGWKLGSLLAQIPYVGGFLQTILGLAMAVYGAFQFVQGFVDAWENGTTWDNLTKMVGGLALVVAGLGIAFGATAAVVALLVGGFALLVVGIRDWIKEGELGTETFWLLEAGIAAVGVAAALLLGPWALLVAGIAAGALAIYKNWDKIKQKWDALCEWFHEGWNNLKKWWEGLSLPAFHIPAPHFEWTYTQAEGLIARALEFVGLPATIPHLHISWYAQGGFPDVGSMFIAGESGPELVGSFGGHNNSVINEAQLVEAFRQASSEQVSLLQQQNSLLAAILNKSNEVVFRPSSAAGKAFQQSINMYSRATG